MNTCCSFNQMYLQVACDKGHGGALHHTDCHLTGKEHQIWLEKYIQCLPSFCIRQRPEHSGDGL